MKPALGWTMMSREEMRQVERSLANSEQDTRDEIGFLLIHQGFAMKGSSKPFRVKNIRATRSIPLPVTTIAARRVAMLMKL